MREVDELLGAGWHPATVPPQPCEECERAERMVLVGAVVGGFLMGAAFAYLITRRK